MIRLSFLYPTWAASQKIRRWGKPYLCIWRIRNVIGVFNLDNIFLKILLMAVDRGLRKQRSHLKYRNYRDKSDKQVDQRKEETQSSHKHRDIEYRR